MRDVKDGEVKFTHFRMPSEQNKLDGIVVVGISPQGGATVAYVTNGNVTLAAVAYCNPKDNFSHAMGRVKSNGRLTGLMANHEKVDDDKYFKYEGDDRVGFLRRLHDFMCTDLGYIHRGTKHKTAA